MSLYSENHGNTIKSTATSSGFVTISLAKSLCSVFIVSHVRDVFNALALKVSLFTSHKGGLRTSHYYRTNPLQKLCFLLKGKVQENKNLDNSTCINKLNTYTYLTGT